MSRHTPNQINLPVIEGASEITGLLQERLAVHETGFPTDGQYLYMFRRSLHDAAAGAFPAALYNDTLRENGTRHIWQATEGHGLYVANSAQATQVHGVKGDKLHILRAPLDQLDILDAHGSLSTLLPGQKVAAVLHRNRALMPGIPNPGPKNWDKLYGDSDLVVFRPMAAARLSITLKNAGRTGYQQPRWGLIRTPEKVEIIHTLNM